MKQQLELENEQWKTIENYEDYEVSNFGKIKSLKGKQERILKQYTIKGYQRVALCKDGKVKNLYVHRLVAMTFISNPNNYEQVNHKDECKTNNHVSNLEWCDCKYNINYGTACERRSKSLSGENSPKPMSGKFGKEHNRSKQIIQLSLDGEFVKAWDSMMDIKRELGYSQGNISSCCSGRYKSANGFKWCYA